MNRQSDKLNSNLMKIIKKFNPEPEVSYVKEFRINSKLKKMRRPGIEPGSTAWKAAMLTTIPPTLVKQGRNIQRYLSLS